VVATTTYSPSRSQLSSVSYTKGTATLFGLKYFYQRDATNCPAGTLADNGQVQCIVDTVDVGRNLSYTYDVLNRLGTAKTKGSTTYPLWSLSESYDRYGNRSAQAIVAGSGFASSLNINPVNNQIVGDTYDAAGNMTGDSLHTYAFDAENRIKTVDATSTPMHLTPRTESRR
jgi:hypothetical protein